MQNFVTGHIWIKEIPLCFFGVEMGARMTVIRMADGGLFVHSPTRLDRDTRQELDALGHIRIIVAPNKLHHLFVGDYFAAFPGARIFCSPDLVNKRQDLPWHGVLGDHAEPAWAEEFDQAMFHGSIYMDEIVFCHRPTKTLIVTDLLENLHNLTKPHERLLAKLAGNLEKPRLTRDQRLCLWNRKTARASAEKIASWDFERIILAHGRLIERDGKAVFREAFPWLL